MEKHESDELDKILSANNKDEGELQMMTDVMLLVPRISDTHF